MAVQNGHFNIALVTAKNVFDPIQLGQPGDVHILDHILKHFAARLGFKGVF